MDGAERGVSKADSGVVRRRLKAVLKFEYTEHEQLSGVAAVASQQDYLETLVDLSERRAIARIMYLVEATAEAAV